MKLSTLMVINAVVALAFALGLLLMPATLASLYGMTSGSSEQLMSQFFGVALVAIGLLTWFARNVTDAGTRRAIILALLVSDAIGVIVSVLGTLSGVMNAVGWSVVALYLLLGLGYAYFQFMKPSAP